jgi:four helix bundle protein
MKSFRDLEIYQIAFSFVIEVHQFTMNLPEHEKYEQGGQLRRSSKSIKDNIAEGYGRRRYKNEFLRFLIFAHASCDESLSQLMMINEIYCKAHPVNELIEKNKLLGRKINKFIQYVDQNWRTN